jgi:hypothetical protein
MHPGRFGESHAEYQFILGAAQARRRVVKMIYDRTFKQLITCVNSQIEELSEELEEP